VDDSGELTQRVEDDRQYVADARQNLQAIGEADHAVVTLVVGQVVLVHGVQTRRGHAGSHAAEGLQAKAEVGARGLAATTGLDAAAALRTDVALAAQVLGHVVFQDLA
jgi:hypothetical protein